MSTLSFLNINVMGLAQLIGYCQNFCSSKCNGDNILILGFISRRLGERSDEGKKNKRNVFKVY